MSEETKPLSPLYEADPSSIDELFLRLKNNQIKLMPREILFQDFPKRVQTLRADRAKFLNLQEENNKNRSERKTRGTSNSQAAIIERLKNNPLSF